MERLGNNTTKEGERWLEKTDDIGGCGRGCGN